MKRLPLYLFIFLAGIAIAQAVYYYPMMPERMASHFGLGGNADNWSPKNVFFLFEALMFLLMIGLFLLMPWSFEKFKVKKMNLPNREYWLAPARIGEVYRYFRESFGWFGIAHMIFLIGVMQLVFVANMTPQAGLNNTVFLSLLVGYFLFAIIWVISFYRKFQKVQTEE